jgi:hypothetical protein
LQVTVCVPGTQTCQVLSDVLLDTGSSGLRVFASALTLALAPVSSSAGTLTECLPFLGGQSDWGSVREADVVLGGEPAVTVPIQVIDANFPGSATYCPNPADPTNAGYTAILGVGLFDADCGPVCNNQHGTYYYNCTAGSCTATTTPAARVRNPIALLPHDNNGVLIELPSLPEGGATSASGYLVLGIGTETNNVPAGVTLYAADPGTGEFFTQFNNRIYPAAIDSGSNGLFFPGALTGCTGDLAGLFCPSIPAELRATIAGAAGGPSVTVAFQIDDFAMFAASTNRVSAEVGGTEAGTFIWGLPFFFGHKVYIGLAGAVSSLGTGPYWAF